jgi:hypothetical protein
MTICTYESDQILGLQQHLDNAAGLSESALEDICRLVKQLDGKLVLPLVGAGGSYDCGMPLARKIGEDLLDDYLKDPAYEPHAAELGPDLADITEAIWEKAGQKAVVDALGLSDPTLWPDLHSITPHFCAYRILARLAREQIYSQAVTLNYDCAYEAALHSEGFLLAPDSTAGAHWNDHVSLIVDARSENAPEDEGSLTLRKFHGCAKHYRDEVARGATDEPEERIVVRRAQLTHWRADEWARDYIRHAGRKHILLLLGFSAQDAIITGEISSLLKDVFAHEATPGIPRIVVINHEPDTAPLRGIIKTGLGEVPAIAGTVTQIRTAPTTTATMLALLTETLHHHLKATMETFTYTLPIDLDARMAALTIAAPVMLRWSYLLRRPAEDSFNQRTNLHAAARRGYVPLRADPDTTIRAIKTRNELRAALGRAEPECTREALSNHTFIADPSAGVAYLPCGLDLDTLRGGARPAGELQMTRETLPWPKHLDCVLVAEDSTGRRGINLASGHEVNVP